MEVDAIGVAPLQKAKVDFGFFDAIYCINLQKRTDRLSQAQEQFDSISISDKVKIFKAIENPEGWKGLLDSHISLIREAKKDGLKNIMILEDDVVFLENDSLYFKSLFSSLEELNEFHLFYLSANVEIRLKKKNDFLYVARHCLSTHSVCYSNSIYEKILSDYDEIGYEMGPIDMYLKNSIQTLEKSYVASRCCTTQAPGYSDIENKDVNYDFIVERFKNNKPRCR